MPGKIDFFGILWKALEVDWPIFLVAFGMLAVAAGVAHWDRFRRGIKNGPMALEDALSIGECQGIEFKCGIPEKVIANSIAAFSNSNNGTIFLGVDDDGGVVGIPAGSPKEKDAILKRVRNFTAQEIKPPVVPVCDFLIHEEKTVLRIFVPRGRRPLYMVDGVVYVRHLNSTTKAGPERIEEIFRRHFASREN